MKIGFTLPSRRGSPPPAFTPEPVCEPEGRPHRIARVMALPIGWTNWFDLAR
jgi:hypothetical protein